jgi:integrase
VVQPSGARSWAVRYRQGGRTRKHTVGPYPAIDLKAARELAAKALRAVATGGDPGREKMQARGVQPDTVEAVAALFIERHCLRSTRARTAEETQRLLDLHVLPRWRARLMRDVTRRDVIDLLDRVVDGGSPVAANRTLSVIRKLFGWALDRDIISMTPVAGVRPPTVEISRDRVLSDAELALVWRGADQLGGSYGALVKLLMLCGQRRDEVAALPWSEIDLSEKMWRLPAARTKNGKAHDVPLSEPVVAILQALPRIGDTFVLTTNGTAPASNYGKNKRRLDAAITAINGGPIPHWTLHDLRRSAASGMARLGVNLPVIERILNHSGASFSGAAGVYQRFDFAGEKRHALERWGTHVADLVLPHRSLNAVRLEERA